jgi:iron complex transport system substrate-binding protein
MKRATLLVAAAVLALIATGCAKSTDKPGDTQSAAAYPVTVGDLTLNAKPTHIVSLSSTATEMLFAIDAGSQVVAVDDQSNYPPDAPKSDLSGYTPNAEAIAAKQPDLVVISNDSNKIKSQLEQLKIPVLLAPAAATLTEAYQQFFDLGKLTGHDTEAAAEVAKIREELNKIVSSTRKRSKPVSYYYELDNTLYSLTSKTFAGDVFKLFGMTNIADSADDGSKGGYPQLSEEALIAANPDTIFLADAECCGETPDKVKTRVGWGGISAVKNNQVFALNGDIASRWGPRVVDLAQSISDALAKVPA